MGAFANSAAQNRTAPATISLMQQDFFLVARSGLPGFITLKNQSFTVTALNIKATLPPSWRDVIQDASNCSVVPPRKNCKLKFMAGAAHSLIPVSIRGTNTTQQIINMAVLGLVTATGDPHVTATPASQTVDYNSTGTITVHPATGYSAAIATDTCGGSLSGSTYTTGAITDSCSVSFNSIPNGFTVGGSLTGYTSSGLVLQNNNADNLSPSGSGSFTFSTPLASGATYSVTVLTQPTGQTCSVLNGTGSIATSNITNVSVSCTTNTFTLTASSGANGTLSPTGAVVVNEGSNQTFTATPNSNYAVDQWLVDGTVVQTGGTTYQLNNVTANHTVSVTFNLITYTVGGSLTGYTSSGLVLQNNNADNLSPSGSGSFTFSTPLASGATYSVTVLTQPTGQTCSVLNGTGSIATSNITNVSVSCTTNTFTLTASSGANGTLSPTGAVVVNEGSNQTFTATPNSNYAVNQWLVDGTVVQTGGTTYQLNSVTANHTVSVTFVSTATTITATPLLALSVTGLTTTTGNNSGTARFIKITNTGANVASNVNYTVSPALPSGSSISPASCGSIAVGATCTLTVTPGATPSAPVGNNSPTPVTVNITGDNTNSPTSSVSILTYGSFYQAGWLFSIIETANTSAKIGGTVAGESDVAGQSTTQYSSGAANTTTSMYSGTNGSANTAAMKAQYGSGTNYSAGLCISPNYTAGGYTDWYLPAICQMGYNASDTNFNCTNSGSANYIPNIQVNLLQKYPTRLFNFTNNGYYWSSTASQSGASSNAWSQEYILGGGAGLGGSDPVNFIHGVRCARNLT